MIQLIELTKIFNGISAVDRVNLTVQKGLIYGFLGPNGAGKTTTLKMMAGILKPTSGRVIIDGKDLAANPSEVKRIVGFIPDRPFLYERLSGIEFLHFIAGLYGLDENRELNIRIEKLLELFELSLWGEELIESYSHGMKQRLVMCSCLLHRPRLLIVDEPMVGLDPKGVRLVKDLFRRESRSGTTLFMSTHSLEVAQEVCHRVAIIQAGKIVAEGTPEALRQTAGVDGDLEQVFLKITQGQVGHERSLPPC
jgi:ABC-2 type transport system ATP-binding protein